MLGLWSLVLALLSLTSIGSAGFAGSATKFVAKYHALDQENSLINVIETITIVVSSISLVLIIIINATFKYYDHYLFNEFELISVYKILPWVLFSMFFGLIGRVYLSVLDGLHLIYIRSYIGIVSKVIYVFVCLVLIPKYGIEGLAISYLINMLLILILSIYSVKHYLPKIRIFMPKFNKQIFQQIFSYGFNFQLGAIFQMLIDPVTKLLLKDFAGLTQLGYFEVVYKFYTHSKQLIVVTVNTFVPVVASLKELAIKKIRTLYKNIFISILITSVIILAYLFASLPILLSIVEVNMNSEMLIFSVLIFIGFLFSLMAVPAYLFNLGIGNIKINTITIGVLAISNFLFGLILGREYNGIGVVLGWTIAQVIASITLLLLFLKLEKINSIQLISKEDYLLFLSFFIAMTLIFFINIKYDNNTFTEVIINYAVLLLFTTIPIYKNKNIRKLIKKKNID